MPDEVSTDTRLALLANDMGYLKDTVHSIDLKLSSSYVTKEETARLADRVKLLERLVYGIISVVGLGVLYAILNAIGLTHVK